MKKIIKPIVLASLFVIFSCNRTTHLGRAVGSDKDANGCIGSAGYQWSKLKNECIRTFELPLQLTNKEQTFTAGIYFSTDLKQAEVFTMDGVFIMNLQADGGYLSEQAVDIYRLKKTNNKWEFGNVKIAEPSYKEQ